MIRELLVCLSACLVKHSVFLCISGDFSESMIAVVKKRRRSKPPKNRESTVSVK